MQLQLSSHAQASIDLSARELAAYLLSEFGEEYSIAQIRGIVLKCLEAVVEEWCADAVAHCTRPQPYGHSQTEFHRLIRKIQPCN